MSFVRYEFNNALTNSVYQAIHSSSSINSCSMPFPAFNDSIPLFKCTILLSLKKGSMDTSKGIRFYLHIFFAKIVKAVVIFMPNSWQIFSMLCFNSSSMRKLIDVWAMLSTPFFVLLLCAIIKALSIHRINLRI